MPKRMNANSLANLRPPWKPGESGNPNGRAEGSMNFETIIQRMGGPEATVARIYKIATEGGDTEALKAAEMIWRRIYPATQKLELEGTLTHEQRAQARTRVLALARRLALDGDAEGRRGPVGLAAPREALAAAAEDGAPDLADSDGPGVGEDTDRG